MTGICPRLWETPRLDATSLFGGETSPLLSEVDSVLLAAVTISDDARGFVLANVAGSDVVVLVTLMAKALGDDAVHAREALLRLTSAAATSEPLRIAPAGDSTAYSSLWLDDVTVRREPHGGFAATRSGTVVAPVRAGGTFALAHSSGHLPDGIVVAMIAGIAPGLDAWAPLWPIECGAWASHGEKPPVREGGTV